MQLSGHGGYRRDVCSKKCKTMCTGFNGHPNGIDVMDMWMHADMDFFR